MSGLNISYSRPLKKPQTRLESSESKNFAFSKTSDQSPPRLKITCLVDHLRIGQFWAFFGPIKSLCIILKFPKMIHSLLTRRSLCTKIGQKWPKIPKIETSKFFFESQGLIHSLDHKIVKMTNFDEIFIKILDTCRVWIFLQYGYVWKWISFVSFWKTYTVSTDWDCALHQFPNFFAFSKKILKSRDL